MSLIERALQKMRRAGESEAVPLDSREPGARSDGEPRVKLAALPEPLPPAREPARRITVELASLRAAGYLPEKGLERRFADHYRQIKRPLIEKALAGSPETRLILVTSALPGDGKTFTSINLALSMARERDISVLLVDADAQRAQVSQVFGFRREPGLHDALSDESVDVEALIGATDVRGLELLPAGRFVENATELLASARMGQIAARIGARNPRRLVLFDTAPLLAASEARVMMRICGQVVVVARAGVTPRQALLDALGQVDRSKLQGVILNCARFSSGGGYYEYPGYGDGASGTEDSD